MAVINQVLKTIMGITGNKPSLDSKLAIFHMDQAHIATAPSYVDEKE